MGFMLLSALGFTQIMGRFVPQFTLQEDRAGLRAFLGTLLAARLASGALAGGLYLSVTVLWLRELDRWMLVFVAGSVFVRAVNQLVFALFLGLNEAGRWGMAEVVRRWTLLVFLLLGFYLGGLRGACLGLLLTELIVLSLGGWWARSYLTWSDLRLDARHLMPYLRFGLIFFASDLLMIAFQRSGEALVRAASGDYVQVGYFGVACGAYFTAALIIPQVTLAFAPLLITLRAQNQTEAFSEWVERLIKWLTIGGVLAVLGALLLGWDLVPLVLGTAYMPVAASLVPMALTLLAAAPSGVAALLALTCDRPEVALATAGVRLAAFWCFGPPLIAWLGSLGGCLAVLLASSLDAAYFTWRMRKVVRYSLRRWALIIGLGGAFLPLIWLRSTWPVNLALYVVFVAGYGGILFLLRVMEPAEIVAAWRAIAMRGQPLKPAR
jgi:O-antigen/teichoic acid export membrane protein